MAIGYFFKLNGAKVLIDAFKTQKEEKKFCQFIYTFIKKGNIDCNVTSSNIAELIKAIFCIDVRTIESEDGSIQDIIKACKPDVLISDVSYNTIQFSVSDTKGNNSNEKITITMLDDHKFIHIPHNDFESFLRVQQKLDNVNRYLFKD